jgi:hypothetical protein
MCGKLILNLRGSYARTTLLAKMQQIITFTAARSQQNWFCGLESLFDKGQIAHDWHTWLGDFD